MIHKCVPLYSGLESNHLLCPRNASDVSLIMLALNYITAIMKLCATKLSSTKYSALLPKMLGRLMDILVEFVSLQWAYHSVKPIGMHREFFIHYFSKVAPCRVQTDSGTE